MNTRGIDKHWLNFILHTLTSPASFLNSTGRKYLLNTSFSIPGEDWHKGLGFDVNDLGYRGQTAKMKQLSRVYLNVEGIKAAREKLEGRLEKDMDFSSVAVPMQGGDKDGRSQGHCMISCSVNYIPKDLEGKPQTIVTMFYRVTEVIQKFGADLIFLHDVVLPKLLPKKMYPITKVNFVFANAFFSPLFTPVLYRYIDPLTFLKFIKPHTLDKQNPRERSTFRSCARAIVLPMVEKDPEHYNYRTRRIMHQLSIANLGEDYNPEPVIEYLRSIGQFTWEDKLNHLQD